MFKLLFLWAAFLVFDSDTEPSKPYLLYSNLTNIGAIDLSNRKQTDVLSGLQRVVPLGMDSVDNKFYYGEHSMGKIFRSNMDGTGVELILSDVGHVEGIAIDWVARLIYWTSYTSGKIEVATLDGKYRKVLLNTGLEYPRGMALDPSEGYLFWSDWGAAAAIERSTLVGNNRTALVKDDIMLPNGITIDYTKKLIYWIDAYHDTISFVDYNGGNRTKLFEDKSLTVSKLHGFDLDIVNDVIYWTDWSSNAIFDLERTKSNPSISTNISIETSSSSKGVMGLVAVDSSRQRPGSNRCGNNNGGCQQLCLQEPKGFKCACQIGMILAEDGKTCEDTFKDEFVMFADADAGKIYQIPTNDINVAPSPIKFGHEVNISRPVALEYDPVEERVYWTDVTLKIISRAFRNGSNFEQIVTDQVGTADGLTLDLAGRNLYWTSTTFNTIEMSRLDGSYRRVLLSEELYQPRDIIVDSIAGYLYWTDWGISKIERAFMDGSNRTVLVNKTLRWPNGLTIDHVYNKLYWADAWEDSIETIDLKSGKRDVIVNEKIKFFDELYSMSSYTSHPFGLTLLHEHIYWTDWYSDKLYRAAVNTGANVITLASDLGKPMDIHAYSTKPTPEQRKSYTFSFPKSGSNFSCIANRTCPSIPAPPQCPSGYNTSREGAVCGLYCRDIVGYTYRCPCKSWTDCAVKEYYKTGCANSHYYLSSRVRECVQVVRPGRCPIHVTKGSLHSCVNDEACPGTEKCCDGQCAQAATVATHACQTNNGGCDQLCIPMPEGHQCSCKDRFIYNVTRKQCVKNRSPPSPVKGCSSIQPLGNGTISGTHMYYNCTRDTVPFYQDCKFKCNEGFKLIGPTSISCRPGASWNTQPRICLEYDGPIFSHCPKNITVGTEKGESFKYVNWSVPTAKDHLGYSVHVSASPSIYLKPPLKFSVGIRHVIYKATDGDLITYCRFSIEVKDLESPSLTCPADINRYVASESASVVWTVPKAEDNVDGPVTVHSTGVSPNDTYPAGTTTITYTAADSAGLNTTCSFNIIVTNVCRTVRCGFGSTCTLDGTSSRCSCNMLCTEKEYQPVCGSDGRTYSNKCKLKLARCRQQKDIQFVRTGKCSDCSTLACAFGSTCQVKNEEASCVCDVKCADGTGPVCGSDGRTYDYKCKMLNNGCHEQRNIFSIKESSCGCGKNLEMDATYKNTSSILCSNSDNTVQCNITCKQHYAAVFDSFLKLKCNNGQWIRKNGAQKYVPVNVRTPPRCYQKMAKKPQKPFCSPGYELLYGEVCVSCPPGSYYEDNTSRCALCQVTTFQNKSAQRSCKPCLSPWTTTTTGAENCFFNHEGFSVKMVFEDSIVESNNLRKTLANGLTDLCRKTKCSLTDSQARRRKREPSNTFNFKEEHVVILSLKEQQNSQGMEAELFVLVPSSTELVPTKALSAQDLQNLLKSLIGEKTFPYKVSKVYAPNVGQTSSDDSGSSRTPVVVGTIFAVIILLALVAAAYIFTRRRRTKRCLEDNPPTVNFRQDGHGGTMQIGGPTPVVDERTYEDPEAIASGVQHGFVNQIYNDVHQPPPYYANTPVHSGTGAARPSTDTPHVYDNPDMTQAGALPAKEPLPEDAVVDLVPAKQVDLPDQKQAEPPVKFFQKRAPDNVNSLPRDFENPAYEEPVGAEASLKLDPPPKYDDAQLRIIREKTASSILPNVPRQKQGERRDKSDIESGARQGSERTGVQDQ